MKYFLFSLATLLFFQLSFSQKTTVDYLITNISIVPMNTETVLKNKDIAIKDGKILAIVDTKKGAFETKQKIDGKGKYLMPTMGDAHVHLPGKEEDLSKLFNLYLINGVTKLRSMRGEVVHLDWKKKYNTESGFLPKMYLSSTPIYKNYDFTDEQLITFVKNFKDKGFDFIKLLGIKSEDLFIKLDKLCKENNIKIAGHFPSIPNETVIKEDVIFNSNLNSIEHLGGLIGEKNVFESRLKAIKAKNIFVCPTLDWYLISYGQFNLEDMKNKRGMEFIDPSVFKQWVDKTTKYNEKTGKVALDKEITFYAKEIEERLDVINRLNSEGIKLLLSPDSSSRFIVPGFGIMEEMLLYKKAGLSNYDILKTVTTNFAQYFNESSYGTIETGKNADFILLNENPLDKLETLQSIQGLFFNSNFLDKKKLESLANSAMPKKN